MASRGKTKAQEDSLIELYPKKNNDPFHYKTINGTRYWYRYYDYGKEYIVRIFKSLRKRGYKVRLEYVSPEQYIIWRSIIKDGK
jgi:hypothetical protein